MRLRDGPSKHKYSLKDLKDEENLRKQSTLFIFPEPVVGIIESIMQTSFKQLLWKEHEKYWSTILAIIHGKRIMSSN